MLLYTLLIYVISIYLIVLILKIIIMIMMIIRKLCIVTKVENSNQIIFTLKYFTLKKHYCIFIINLFGL